MASYSEKLIATVELNLSDFQEKMRAADLSVDALAKTTDRRVVTQTFSRTGDKMIDAAVKAMDVFAQEVMGDSVFEVPVDTTILRDSARVEDAVQVGKRIKVKMGYGDAINPKTKRTADQYALPVHEIYYAEHEPPTKSHYLIDPLIEHAPKLKYQIKAWIQKSLIPTHLLQIERRSSLFSKGGGVGVPALRGPGGRFIKRPKA